MKKILILVSLVALVASGLFAEVTFTGKVQTAAQDPLNNDYPFATDNAAELQANIKADDATSGVLKVKYGSGDLTTTGTVAGFPFSATGKLSGIIVLDRAHFTSDYLKAFGLGMDDLVTITGNYGYNEFAIASVGNVTSYDTTKAFKRKFTAWGMAQAVEVLKMVKLTAALDLSRSVSGANNFFVDLVATVPNAGPGTIKGEVAYVGAPVPTDKVGEGALNVQAAYEMTGLVTGLTVAPGVGYQADLAKAAGDKAADDEIAGGVKVAYDTDLFGVYVNGGARYKLDTDDNKTNNLVYIPVALGASYSKIVGVDLGLFLDMSAEEARGAKTDASGAQGTFDHFDGSLWVMAAKAKFRLGYLFVPDKETVAQDKLNAAAKDNGARGLYFKATLEY